MRAPPLSHIITQAKAARNEIDQIRNFVPQGPGAEPVLYDIRIAFGDDVDFASQNIAGAELDSDGRGVVIRSVADYSPASTAGMQPGMRVDAIQGTDTRRANVQQVRMPLSCGFLVLFFVTKSIFVTKNTDVEQPSRDDSSPSLCPMSAVCCLNRTHPLLRALSSYRTCDMTLSMLPYCRLAWQCYAGFGSGGGGTGYAACATGRVSRHRGDNHAA